MEFLSHDFDGSSVYHVFISIPLPEESKQLATDLVNSLMVWAKENCDVYLRTRPTDGGAYCLLFRATFYRLADWKAPGKVFEPIEYSEHQCLGLCESLSALKFNG